MPGTFFGLETASRALRMNQAVIDVIGHNLANVDSPDYTRQNAEIRATDPYQSNSPGVAPVSYGTGVELSAINRVRDAYVEQRLNDAMSDQGRWQQLNDTLSRVQAGYNEPGDAGLNSSLTTFFNSFEDVSRDPQNTGPRTIVLHNAQDVVNKFRSVYDTLTGSSLDIGQRISAMVTQVNDLAHEIAKLNLEVTKATAAGGQANDLEDRRDGLVRQMSQLAGVTVVVESDGKGKPTGSVNLSLGGVPLVEGSSVMEVPSKYDMVRGEPVLLNGTTPIPVRTGQLAGLIQSNAQIQSYMQDLNQVASTFISSVNAQHEA